jgi:hypothetical protein
MTNFGKKLKKNKQPVLSDIEVYSSNTSMSRLMACIEIALLKKTIKKADDLKKFQQDLIYKD